MNLEAINKGPAYACLLANLSDPKDLFVHCLISKNVREIAIREIFKRGSATWNYQFRLFHFHLQQGQVLPNSGLIVQLFKNLYKEKEQYGHNTIVLADNTDKKLVESKDADEMILCCLSQNINNGIRLFNPKNRFAIMLTSQSPLGPFWLYYESSDQFSQASLEYFYIAVRHAQDFISASGDITQEDAVRFSMSLNQLKDLENIPDIQLLNTLLASLVTCLLIIDETLLKRDMYLRENLVQMIFYTLSDYAGYLPKPHVLGLIHLCLNQYLQKRFIICKIAESLPEDMRHCFMEMLIERMIKEPFNEIILDVIGQLASWLNDTQISTVLDHLTKCEFNSELSWYTISFLKTHGKVAAHSKYKEEKFVQLISDWKGCQSEQHRSNVLSIIAYMTTGFSAERCFETIKVIHQNLTELDIFYGLTVLSKHLKEKLEKNDTREQLDEVFQYFIKVLQDDQRYNIIRATVEAFDQLLPMLSDLQKKTLLPVIFSLFSRPHLDKYYIVRLHMVVSALPKSERMPQLMANLPVAGISLGDLLLKYRGLSDSKIEELHKLSKSEWKSNLSYQQPLNLLHWVFVIENASPEIGRLITAKLLEVYPDNEPTISLEDMTLDEWSGIVDATIKCMQNDDHDVQDAGIFVLEQLKRDKCNLSLFKDKLLTPLQDV